MTQYTHPTIDMDDLDLIQDFLQESDEHLQNVETAFLAIEDDLEDTEPIHSAFRAFHTIKGIAGFLGFTTIQTLTHNAETLLDKTRNNEIAVSPEIADLVLQAQAMLKDLIQDIASLVEGGSPETNLDAVPDLITQLQLAAENKGAEVASTPEPEEAQEEQEAASEPEESESEEEVEVEECQEEQAEVTEAKETPEAKPAESNKSAEPAKPAKPAAKAKAESGKDKLTSFLKVDTQKLDTLVEMVGELVITQSQVASNKVIAECADDRLNKDLDQLEKTLKDVQDLSLSLRMIPVKGLFQKMSRVVRDLSRELGKDIKMVLVGEDTELDKTVIEKMHDPLVHMIRNSVDHGIEMPEDRLAAGKTKTGTITLRASHRGGNILIEIMDNGKGLNKEAILTKARAQGMIGPDQTPPDSELYGLVFKPGFSTAKVVTNVSGRGVGMDVVYRNIKELRGRVDVESTPNKGSNFLVKLPLTLAIIEGMITRILDEEYIIPITAVRESLMLKPEDISTVEGRGEMIERRGRFIPLVRLEESMEISYDREDLDRILTVVIEHEGGIAALRVDDIIGQQQVVIKSLGEMFSNLPGIAGCAILGDGKVCMILDVAATVAMTQ